MLGRRRRTRIEGPSSARVPPKVGHGTRWGHVPSWPCDSSDTKSCATRTSRATIRRASRRCRGGDVPPCGACRRRHHFVARVLEDLQQADGRLVPDHRLLGRWLGGIALQHVCAGLPSAFDGGVGQLVHQALTADFLRTTKQVTDQTPPSSRSIRIHAVLRLQIRGVTVPKRLSSATRERTTEAHRGAPSRGPTGSGESCAPEAELQTGGVTASSRRSVRQTLLLRWCRIAWTG